MITIKVDLDLEMKKMNMSVAEVKGTIEIDVLVEKVTGTMVKEELINTLKEKELEGSIFIDDTEYQI